MIDVYTWPTPNGHKIHIMLEECSLSYRIHGINIRVGEQFEEEFLKISPNNRIPAIIDQDGPSGEPYSLFESGAILIYLAEKTGKFLSDQPKERFNTLQWLMFQMGNIGPMFGQAHHFRNYAAERMDYPIERYTNEAGRLYHILDKRLSETEYLAGGSYSIADIATFPWARNPERRGQDIDSMPNVKRWINHIGTRPMVVRAMKILEKNQSKPPDVIDEETRSIMFGARQFEKR